ncbi:hypothetical protein D3C81_1517500 [compost metagenome]
MCDARVSWARGERRNHAATKAMEPCSTPKKKNVSWKPDDSIIAAMGRIVAAAPAP